ncbi:MAG: ATP-dependent sacrificial sulfur transferase LarE, partial [Candidatus Binatia bacterium]
PGLQAADQWRVRHPLVEAGMTKDDIRRYSQELALPTWDKPSSPCLSSRFPYGTAIDLAKLKQVGACELFLKGLGFREFRVRYHGDLARIEVNQNEIDRLFDKTIRDAIVTRFKEVGFSFVSLDLQGFRSGSLNEVLKAPAR